MQFLQTLSFLSVYECLHVHKIASTGIDNTVYSNSLIIG